MTEAASGRFVDKAALIALQISVDDFLHAAVHDLRGPLGQVRALAVLLERQHRNSLDADGLELCGLIDAASKRAVDVVESIHTYARILEAPVLEVADMNMIFDAARFTLQTVIDQSLALITREDLAFVCGDRAKLLLLFAELFRNALKFRTETAPRIHCSAKPAEDSNRLILFSMVDNGVGIQAKDSEAVFKPLKRLHGRDFEGTGMGLAICRRIVEVHGGEIWVDARSEGGSDFRFTLPST